MKGCNFLGAVLLVLALAGCSGPPDLGQFSQSDLCKAGVAVGVTGDVGNTGVMRANEQSEIFYIEYNRLSDGKLWKYMCRIKGDRVIWGSAGGRWHMHESEPVMTYSVDAGELVLSEDFPDGTKNIVRFSADRF